MPAPAATPPRATGSANPKRALRRPATGARRENITVLARTRKPNWTADRPWTSWKYRARKKGSEMRAKPAMKVTAAVAEKRRDPKSARGSIGSVDRASTHTNVSSRVVPTTSGRPPGAPPKGGCRAR